MTIRSLELLTANNPTVRLMEQQRKQEEDQRHQDEHERLSIAQEEADYQRAIANSLGIPAIVPVSSQTPASSSKPPTVGGG